MSERIDIPPTSATNFQQRVRETLMTYLGKQGNSLDRGLTLRDLLENGILKLGSGWRGGSGVPQLEPGAAVINASEPDLTPPPPPDGFAVSAAISHVFIEHAAPLYPQGHGHLRTRVYGATVAAGGALPTFSDAVEVGQFSGTVWAMPSNPATTWRLWIKWESHDGVLSTSPAGGTNGLEAVTGQDVDSMVKAMTGEGKPFTVLPTEQVIDGVTYPAGVYATQAFIADLQVTRAKIANLAVDNAKIADLSADKLTAGSIAVGQHIQSASYVAGLSGWRINGDGTAEFSNAVVRGSIFASEGEIGGIKILSDRVQSNNYSAGSSGWVLRQDGYAEFVNAKISGASVATLESVSFSVPIAEQIATQTKSGSISFSMQRPGAVFFSGGIRGGILYEALASENLAELLMTGNYEFSLKLDGSVVQTGVAPLWEGKGIPVSKSMVLGQGMHTLTLEISTTGYQLSTGGFVMPKAGEHSAAISIFKLFD